jgi:hypothetical protein
MNSLLFAVVTFALWISPVVVIVALVRIARRVGIDLSRQPPPDDIDYKRWQPTPT